MPNENSLSPLSQRNKLKQTIVELKEEHAKATTILINEIKELKKENKQLKCMNNQLEKRLDYSIAYDMEECE